MGTLRTRQFSLSTLLLVVTGICLFLGFAHWRRTSILRESKELEARGFRLLWSGRSPDAFWPVVPKEAAFEFSELSPEEVEIASVRYSVDEANAYCDPLFARLNRIGVEDVLLLKNGKNTNTYCATAGHLTPQVSTSVE